MSLSGEAITSKKLRPAQFLGIFGGTQERRVWLKAQRHQLTKVASKLKKTKAMLNRQLDLRALAPLRGIIRLGPAGEEFPCSITDLTPRGAVLSVANILGLPQSFRLEIDGEAGTRHCRIIWVDGNKAGIQFV